MNEKTLTVIQDAIRHTMNTIEALACENYPHTPFEDKNIAKIYYDLADMSLVLGAKIKAINQGREDA